MVCLGWRNGLDWGLAGGAGRCGHREAFGLRIPGRAGRPRQDASGTSWVDEETGLAEAVTRGAPGFASDGSAPLLQASLGLFAKTFSRTLDAGGSYAAQSKHTGWPLIRITVCVLQQTHSVGSPKEHFMATHLLNPSMGFPTGKENGLSGLG